MVDKWQQRAEPLMEEATSREADRHEDNILALDTEESPPKGLANRIGRFKWLLLAAAIAVAAAVYFSSGYESTQTSRPLTVKVQIGDIENAVTAAGTLQPSQYVDVGAQVSGQLEKLYVDVGDVVAAGDLVAEIDATVQLNRVEASRANLEALQAQLSARESALKLAKSRLERQTRMMAEDATSQDDYDDAVDRLESAQSSLTQLRSQIAQAKASLGSDEATLGYSKIYAPIDGTVVSVAMKEGQTLNAVQMAPTILRIADLSTMTVEAEVSEADVGKLKRGMAVYFTTLGGGERRWEGTLRQILPTPVTENNVVLYTALFDVDNADGTLLTDMTAQVFFVTESAHKVLKVPVGSLTYIDTTSGGPGTEGQGGPSAAGVRGTPSPANTPGGPPVTDAQGGRPGIGADGLPPAGGRQPGRPTGRRSEPGRAATVRVVNADGTIEQRTIRVGVTSRISAEVLSGLSEGEEVVAGIVDTPRQTQQRRGGPFGPF